MKNSNSTITIKALKKASLPILGEKPLTPTQKYYNKNNVKIQYMFCAMNLEKDFLKLDDEKFYKLRDIILEECKKLERENIIESYKIGDYKGTNYVRGCWEIICAK